MKVQDRQNGPSKSFRAYQKKLAGYAPDKGLRPGVFQVGHGEQARVMNLREDWAESTMLSGKTSVTSAVSHVRDSTKSLREKLSLK